MWWLPSLVFYNDVKAEKISATQAYRQTSNISNAKSQNLNIFRLVLQLPLLNLLNPGVKLRMKMQLDQWRQAML